MMRVLKDQQSMHHVEELNQLSTHRDIRLDYKVDNLLLQFHFPKEQKEKKETPLLKKLTSPH